jgi:hypothetical protein
MQEEELRIPGFECYAVRRLSSAEGDVRNTKTNKWIKTIDGYVALRSPKGGTRRIRIESIRRQLFNDVFNDDMLYEWVRIENFPNYGVFRHTTPSGVDAFIISTRVPLKSKKSLISISENGKRTYILLSDLRRSLFPDIRDEDLQFEWRPIPGFSSYGLYRETTPSGVDVFNVHNRKPLTKVVNLSGYNYFGLTSDSGIVKTSLLGRLRLLTFVGPPPEPTFTCDHVNRIRNDDCLANLKWATQSEQKLNRDFLHGNPGLKMPIKRTRLDTGEVEHFASARDVPGFPVHHIFRHLNKRVKGCEYLYQYDTLELLDGEEFRCVQNSSTYISNFGRVARKCVAGLAICSHIFNSVYPSLNIRGKHESIHRVVWKTFVGEIPDGSFIDHIDENKRNFRLDNLRLVTRTENMRLSRGNVYYIYDKTTGEELAANTLNEAAAFTNLSTAHILKLSLRKHTSPRYEIREVCTFQQASRIMPMPAIIFMLNRFECVN